VLEIDSHSAPALGFLGLVYHLMDHLDDAIVKYHEVRIPLPFYQVTSRNSLPSRHGEVMNVSLISVLHSHSFIPSYFISAVALLEVGRTKADIAIRSGNY